MNKVKAILFLGLVGAFVLATQVPARAAQCSLNSFGGRIQHVVYVQFDNVHFTRDNPNVPSDLEQMPNLLNFLVNNGTFLTNHHTPLISHTADDIITSLTGVYPSRQGEAVANSYVIFTPTGFSFPSSFTYWTDPVNTTTDKGFNLIAADGSNAPAPWVPFTRAGCNTGAVSIADMEVENTTSDLVTIFGPNSTEVQEATTDAASSDPKVKAMPAADFEGIAIHCAAGDALCSNTNGGVTDALPDEPGNYNGFSALFGHKFVAPVINSGDPNLKDLDGTIITDSRGNTGFPGFGPITASQSLGYVAAMLEHNVPVVFAYISDAHDDPATGLASGPGQADYVARLATYNKAWGEFFTRLGADGIDQSNTLFIITADEGDHFVGGPPSPANCDGVNTPCTYAKIGEIEANMSDLIADQDPNLASVPFAIHFDMAPAFYISGQPGTGDPLLREFELAASKLTAVSPITGKTDTLTRYLVDHVEMNLLHMITADPLRTPSFIMFADPDYFFEQTGSAPFKCTNPGTPSCPDVVESPGFAWNHGGVDPKINVTFLAMVGPGVQNRGIEHSVWSDHTDIRPTMVEVLGLHDDYDSDGRVLSEILHKNVLPTAIRGGGDFDRDWDDRDDDGGTFLRLARAYKQINAPLGDLGMTSLEISTKALSGNDKKYARLETEIAEITIDRDEIAGEMIRLLGAAEFKNKKINRGEADQLVRAADRLLDRIHDLNGGDHDGHRFDF